jgi:cytochrome P450
MAHDEMKYAEPHLFKPERFLSTDGKLNDDDQILTFGFGRRYADLLHFMLFLTQKKK